jgi:hypothetical protein
LLHMRQQGIVTLLADLLHTLPDLLS